MAKKSRKKAVTLVKIKNLEPTPERKLKGDIDQAKDTKVFRSLTVLEQEYNRGVFNETHFNTGKRFYEIWEWSGLSPHFGSVDLNRFGGGETAYGMPASERQAHYRALYRSAARMLAPSFLVIIEDVVLLDEPLVEVGRVRLGWKDEKQARASAVSLLMAALNALHFHWTRERR